MPREMVDDFDDSTCRPMAVARLMRPYPGTYTEENMADTVEASKINTRGIDVMLILLRVLWSFGNDIFQNRGTFSDEVRAICRTAELNLGWTKEGDWAAKKELFEVIGYGNGSSP